MLKERGSMFFVIGDIFAGALIGVVTTLEVRAFIDPRRDMRILENKSDAGVASSSEVHFQQKISNPVRVVEIFAVHNAPATYADAAPVRTQHPTSSEAQSGQQYYVLRPDLTSAARRQAVNYCITVIAWGACTALLVVGCSRHPKTAATPTYSQAQLAEWGSPPDLDTIPPGPTGDSVRLGRHIFDETPKYASAYVGNKLTCNDCHIQSGTMPKASPMVGLPGIFPLYSKRAKRVISLKDRLNECFVRSENGRPLALDSPAMNALIAYIQWLSQGQTPGHPFSGRGLVKLPDLKGNPQHGAVVFMDKCAICHGTKGAGEPPSIPALWGPNAYNNGAGMNKISKMAAFVQYNMPEYDPRTLTSQEAYDVSAYIHNKPHKPFNEAYRDY
jgi:thiosulfate dehydrogenase